MSRKIAMRLNDWLNGKGRDFLLPEQMCKIASMFYLWSRQSKLESICACNKM